MTRAASGIYLGIPMLEAKSFIVPAGIMPTGILQPLSIMPLIVSLVVPSPPLDTIRSKSAARLLTVSIASSRAWVG